MPTIWSENVSNSVDGAQSRKLAQSLVQQALNNSADPARYEARRKEFPIQTEMGCLPSNLAGILIDEGPSVFHGLAFRMATFGSEDLFVRLEQLLSRARLAESWDKEYSNWNAVDHWAIRWDRFNQFLWMLQCYEYFSAKGGEVSFLFSNASAKPDIHVRYDDGSETYVECYHYTKWWGTEHLVEDLLRAVDQNLHIERMFNQNYNLNPFVNDADESHQKVMAALAEHLDPCRLAELRKQADNQTPVEVCKLGNFRVLLDGLGDYSGRFNAHGDPNSSWPVFQNEILNNKAGSNGLRSHRPNLLMVNSLGIDFQLCLNNEIAVSELPSSIDEAWFCTCGIDDKIETSPRLMARNSNR